MFIGIVLFVEDYKILSEFSGYITVCTMHKNTGEIRVIASVNLKSKKLEPKSCIFVFKYLHFYNVTGLKV